MKSKQLHLFIIITFVSLYFITSLLSTIHSVTFFKLTNSQEYLAISLAIAFEIGAAASLASLAVLHKLKIWLVWSIFLLLTFIQVLGNTFYAFVKIEDTGILFLKWIDFVSGIVGKLKINEYKIIAAILTSSILPLIALGFIKSLVDYLKPEEKETIESPIIDNKEEILINKEEVNDNKKEMSKEDFTNQDITDTIKNQEVLEDLLIDFLNKEKEVKEEPIIKHKRKYNRKPKVEVEPIIVEEQKEEIESEPLINEIKEDVIEEQPTIEDTIEFEIIKKKRGRPFGSKNKKSIIDSIETKEEFVNEVIDENIYGESDSINPAKAIN